MKLLFIRHTTIISACCSRSCCSRSILVSGSCRNVWCGRCVGTLCALCMSYVYDTHTSTCPTAASPSIQRAAQYEQNIRTYPQFVRDVVCARRANKLGMRKNSHLTHTSHKIVPRDCEEHTCKDTHMMRPHMNSAMRLYFIIWRVKDSLFK